MADKTPIPPANAADGQWSRGQQPQVRASKVSQAVAAAIVQDIVSHDLKPGDRLPTEAAMLERFRVGRASIREALRVLEVYGIIALRQGQRGGPVVMPLDPSDLGRTLSFFFHLTGATFRELIDARLVIEPVMAGLAAANQSAEDKDHLQEVMERESASPLEDYVQCANEFHYTVSGMSGNVVLDQIGRALRTIYQGGIGVQPGTPREPDGGVFPDEERPRVRNVHQKIGKAILAGRSAQAQRLMADHMRELADLQAQRTPWFMDERITWQE